MVPYLGDYNTTEIVIIPFNTFTSDDPSASSTISNLVVGDIEIHKDAGLTQRSSDSGVTVTIDFDSVVGNHIVSIDLSDNSDSGFYSAGSRYQVRIEGTTVDGGTINAWIGTFSIGCVLRPSVDGYTIGLGSDGDVLEVNTLTGNTAQSGDAYAAVGLLDADISDILDDTSTTIPGLIGALDLFDPDTDSVNIGAVIGTELTETASGYLAEAISYFFDVATPAKTINDCGVSGSGLSASDVWDYSTRTLTAGTKDSEIDSIVTSTGTTIPALIGVVDTVVDGIQSDLSNSTDGLGALKSLIDTVDTVVDSIYSLIVAVKAVTDALPNSGSLTSLAQASTVTSILEDTGTTIPGLISGLENASVDDIVDAVFAEVLPDITTSSVSAGQSITAKLALRAIFNRLFRLVTQTSATQTVGNDSGSTVASMTVSDDGTTQTKGSA